MPFDGADTGVQVSQVNARGELPDDARLVVVVEEVVQGHRRQQLRAVGLAEARPGRGSGHGRIVGSRQGVVGTHAAAVGKLRPTGTPTQG